MSEVTSVYMQLLTSHFIDAEQLLKVVPHAKLLEIQALLQKHLGDHKEALRSAAFPLFLQNANQNSTRAPKPSHHALVVAWKFCLKWAPFNTACTRLVHCYAAHVK